MKFLFFGTPLYAQIVLEELLKADLQPELVVCNPDRPVGRKHVMSPPEIKVLAQKHGIEVFQPESLNGEVRWPCDLKEMDFALVAAYGKILPKKVVEAPRLGTLGIHPSALPKYRGPSPIRSAILDGADQTAVTIYKMNERMDQGPILWSQKEEIKEDDSHEDLARRLWLAGGRGLIKILPQFLKEKIEFIEQDESKASYTKKFSTEDGQVDVVSIHPQDLYRKMRALNPEPGVFTFTFPGREGKRVKLLEANFDNGVISISKIKPEGKGEIGVDQEFPLRS